MIPYYIPNWLVEIMHKIYHKLDKTCCELVTQKNLEKELWKTLHHK